MAVRLPRWNGDYKVRLAPNTSGGKNFFQDSAYHFRQRKAPHSMAVFHSDCTWIMTAVFLNGDRPRHKIDPIPSEPQRLLKLKSTEALKCDSGTES
jgi:hypothetical protein